MNNSVIIDMPDINKIIQNSNPKSKFNDNIFNENDNKANNSMNIGVDKNCKIYNN